MGNLTEKTATENAVSTEATENASAKTIDVSAKDANVAPSESGAQASTSAATDGKGTTQSEPEWVPDYKFKVRDVEHEFDDFVKPIITKDNHAKVKELYEKAFGLDLAKQRMAKFDEELASYKPKMEELNHFKSLNTKLETMINKKDLASIQKLFPALDDSLIMNRAIEILKMRELTPTEQQAIVEQEQMKAEYYNLVQQNQNYAAEMQHQAHLQKINELDTFISRPEVSAIANQFDTGMGKPGAFKERIIQFGEQTYLSTQKDLSVEEAVNGFLSLAGIKLGAAPMVQPVVQQPQTVVQQPAAPKATIPNIPSSGKTPAKTVMKSISDIRAKARAMS